MTARARGRSGVATTDVPQRPGDHAMRIRVTMYYKPFAGMTDKQKRLEGGGTDMRGNPLHSLEEYLMGDADFVSVARDFRGGPPGNDKRFREYGRRFRIPQIDGLMGWDYIDFRFVDTGDHFTGATKVVVGGV